VAPSTASLFSSIFAKHGIDAPSITGPVTGDTKSGFTASGNGFSAQDFAALGLDPLATDAALFAEPVKGETAPPAFSKPVDDSAGDSIRSGLLKSLGALKTPQSTGGLASQLFNSKQILDLAAEEGLTLTPSAYALGEQAGIVSADQAAMAFFGNASPDGQAQSNAHTTSADIGAGLLLNDAAAGGQDQAGGQNHARQDGQSSNQQPALQGADARLNANAPATDDRAPVLHAAAQADDALLSGAEAHQTAVLSDGTGSEASSFSTASMASAGSGVAPSGSTLGARESLMAVTYAMTGRSSNGSGSALAAEMRFMSLGQQVMAALKQNSQEIELRLNPAQLGNVVLKLQVEGQKLSISARTESQLSDDALSAGEEGLRTSLAANGYQLDKFDVSHQDERRKSQRSETDQSNGPEQKSDDPFSFDLIA
jgi:flagellar hook-length control protein FliK